MCRRAVWTAVLVALSYTAFSQSTPPPPAFDAASIKPSDPGDPLKGPGGVGISFSPGNVSMQNATIKDLIAAAYRVRDYQVAGPSILESGRYDIIARAAGAASEDQQRQMLQALLADRFRLALHHETKEVPVYVLSAGKTPAFSKSKQEAESNLKILGPNMLFLNYTMEKLAAFLSIRGDRPVIDQTGLEGQYDLKVQLVDPATATPVQIKQALGNARADGSLPALITSQLGLRIDPRKNSVDVLVIDHAEKASGN